MNGGSHWRRGKFFRTSENTGTGCVMNGGTRDYMVFHLNINSLRNKVCDLEVLIQELNQPEVLCITEHCLVEEEVNEVIVPGYNSISWNCRRIQKGGGSVIFVNSDTKVDRFVPDVTPIEKDFEFCCIKLMLLRLKKTLNSAVLN
ncbi:hypothetical protein QE152_g29925 [Popillia japonica]|uniref:Uncharacterized protein n=1 Tax=Popillia japonica TaxID=7064 RepID=A0AAW1JFE9_POPJA